MGKNDFKKMKVFFRKKVTIRVGLFILIASIALTFLGFYSYQEGKNSVYWEMEHQQELQEKNQLQIELMQENVSEVKDTFWKFVMIEIMTNWKLFIILLACAIFFRAII